MIHAAFGVFVSSLPLAIVKPINPKEQAQNQDQY
jgi:hypothetical protein